jgi:hypothetical protein
MILCAHEVGARTKAGNPRVGEDRWRPQVQGGARIMNWTETEKWRGRVHRANRKCHQRYLSIKTSGRGDMRHLTGKLGLYGDPTNV